MGDKRILSAIGAATLAQAQEPLAPVSTPVDWAAMASLAPLDISGAHADDDPWALRRSPPTELDLAQSTRLDFHLGVMTDEKEGAGAAATAGSGDANTGDLANAAQAARRTVG